METHIVHGALNGNNDAPCGVSTAYMLAERRVIGATPHMWTAEPEKVNCRGCLSAMGLRMGEIEERDVGNKLMALLPGAAARVPFKPYNYVLLGPPYAGIVRSWKRSNANPGMVEFSFEWHGTATHGGVIVMPSAKSGDVLRWGQKDKHSRSSANVGYGVVLPDFEVAQCNAKEAREWWNKQRRTT